MEVFISYADEDKQLSIDLEHKLKDLGIIVHREKSDLRFGDNWKQKLFPVIRQSNKFILLWSHFSAESTQVMEEIIEAKNGNRQIVPCLIDETAVSPLLKNLHYITLHNLNADFQNLVSDFDLEFETLKEDEKVDIKNAIDIYKKIVSNKFSHLQVLFPDSQKPINDSYLELTLKQGLETDKSNGSISTKKIFELIQHQGEDYIIAGHPGTGKTSTLHYIFHHWSNSQTKSIVLYSRIRDFDPSLHSSLEDFIKEGFLKLLGGKKKLVSVFNNINYFEDLSVILLLDGLDELKAGYYENFIEQLNVFKARYRTSRIVITSRIDGFRDKREVEFIGWTKYSIAKLDNPKIEEFITTWFHNDEKESRLKEKLKNPRLHDLAGRAFLLALICIVFEDDEKKIGNNRSALYLQATSYLEKDRLNRYTDKIIQLRRKILRETALKFLQLNNQELPERFIVAFAENVITEDFKVPMKDFLNEIVTDTGILQNYGDNYAFAHKSFQEYYAAAALQDSPSGENILLAYCQVAQWEETIRLYAGAIENNLEQERFVREIWKINPALALRTITDCNNVADDFLMSLIKQSSSQNRLRMLNEINHSLRVMDLEDAKRLTIETLRPLFKIEHDSAVLYLGIQLLKEFDPEDSGKIMHETFYKGQDSLFQKLQSDKKYKFEFAKIEAGEFLMGDDKSGEKYEQPAHKVKLDSFQISRYQLTNLAYELIMGKLQSKREDDVSEDDDTPVVNLSWYDAYLCAYKVGCRLPTEAEWEYMARAGSSTKWCFGDDDNQLKNYANYVYSNDKTNLSSWKVGTGKPNNWGIYDVHGNVWEWCQDWFGEYSNNKQTNPKGPDYGTSKVRRGGGHAYHALGCRCAFRWGNDPTYKFKDIGVRLAK